MVIAKLRHLHIAPRKVRLVVDLIRGKRVLEAENLLNFTTKKAAAPLLKLLNSAVANAKNSFQQSPDELFISEIKVDEGPKLKRWMPRARGQAAEIQKKTSHITLVLAEMAGQKPKKAKKIAKAASPPQEAGEPRPAKAEREKPSFRPAPEVKKPKIGQSIKRIFRRKSF